MIVRGELSDAHWMRQVAESLQARLQVLVQVSVHVAAPLHSRLEDAPAVSAQVASLHLGLALAPRVKVHSVEEPSHAGSHEAPQVPVQSLPSLHMILALPAASQAQVLPAGQEQVLPVQGQPTPGQSTAADSLLHPEAKAAIDKTSESHRTERMGDSLGTR